MNHHSKSQVISIGLGILLLAAPAVARDILNIVDDHLRCHQKKFDMWGIEQPDWRSLSLDDNILTLMLQKYALYGINTISLQLADPRLNKPFFTPEGKLIDTDTAKQFTAIISGIHNLYIGAVVNLFPAEQKAWLASPDAYREAAQQIATLLPEYHSTVLVIGDLYGAPKWASNCPFSLSNLNNVIELGRIIKKTRPDTLIGVPAKVIPGSYTSELLYIMSEPDELVRWAHAIVKGWNPRQRTKDIVAIRADRFLLRRKIKGNHTTALMRYFERVKQTRLAVPMQVPTSKPASGSAQMSAAEIEDGWQSLFDGHSLNGWTTLMADPAAWVVEDGCLTCQGTGGAWLRTRKRFGDFCLRLEFKIGAKGNSGIFLRAPLDGRASHFGMEMQIRGLKRTPTSIHDSTGAIYDVLAPRIDTSKPVGEWNEAEITCRGSKITIRINGQLVQDFDTDKHPKLQHRLRRGVIGLQDHGDKVSFRNIRIKPLD